MSITALGSHAATGLCVPRNSTPRVRATPAPDEGASTGDPAVQEFLNFAKMSPAEKIRYAYLKEHGLSEDDLKAMSATDRDAIEAEIRQQIRQAVERDTEKKTGRITDVRV
jgi:hypothetical protein